jgi:hypothetical protein
VTSYGQLHRNHKVQDPVRIWVRLDPSHPLVCRKRRLNGAVLRVRLEKNEVPFHSRCDKIEILPCSKALSAEHRPTSCSPTPAMVTSPYKWKILAQTVTPYVTNQSIYTDLDYGSNRLPELESGLTVGVTCREVMLTPLRHLIPPLVNPDFLVCSILKFALPTYLLKLITSLFIHVRFHFLCFLFTIILMDMS